MTDNSSIDDLLAPDTDEESIALSDEEYSHLLDDKEDGELSSESSSIIDTTDFALEEELDYEPPDDDNDLIVNVTAEDMFESDDEDCQNTSPEESTKHGAKIINVSTSGINGSVNLAKNVTSTLSEENYVSEKVVSNAFPQSTIPPPTLPSSLMTRVRERLSTPSPAMVCWHRLHMMKGVERGLDMTTSICSWHLFHTSSKEKSKMLLSDRFREIKTVEEVESEDDGGSVGGGGGGQLSDRFGYLAVITAGRVEGGKRKREEEELPQNMKNKILRRLAGGSRERFGEVEQNYPDNVKFLSDKWRM